MVFSGTVEFEQGSVRHRMTATGAANKKDAEAMASAQLLEALKSQGRPEAKQAAQGESSSGATLQTGNAVGLLQEQAQKNKWQLPEYTFKTLSDVPPKFQATVVVYGAKPGRFQAEGTTKQEAKKKAAEAAVNSWKA
jgi:dsRNA-specific ribonuclease